MTSKVKQGFSPAPWKVCAIFPDKERGHTFEPSVSITGTCTEFGSFRLADIPDVESRDCEQMANARLIAASPVMYEALEAALYFIGKGYVGVKKESQARAEVETKLLAALKSARGE